MKLSELSENWVKSQAGSFETFLRAQNYLIQGMITELNVHDDEVTAQVKGNHGIYQVQLHSGEDQDVQVECTCSSPAVCKHSLAVALAMLSQTAVS